MCAKRCHHACPLLLYTVGNVSHPPSYTSRIVVGAPKGNASSLATGLVYVCPITPGSCELLTNNTGDLADSMLEGVCAWVGVCMHMCACVRVCVSALDGYIGTAVECLSSHTRRGIS